MFFARENVYATALQIKQMVWSEYIVVWAVLNYDAVKSAFYYWICLVAYVNSFLYLHQKTKVWYIYNPINVPVHSSSSG